MVNHLHDDDLPGDGLPRRELDVSHLGRRLAARKRWLIGPALVCLLGSMVAVNLIPPRYTAETKVLVGGQEAYFNRVGNADTQSQPLPDDEAVQSQVQLVSSRDLARQAIAALDLKGNPEFDPVADGVGAVGRFLILLGLERDPMGVPPDERILPRYFDRLTVFPVTKSRVLTIEFESKDADLAAKAANTIADLYLQIQSAAKRDAAHQAAESLRSIVADLRSRSAEAEAKAQEFRSQSGLLLGINNNTISSQQLADLTTQLAQARAGEAEAQAKAKRIRDMVKAGRLTEVPEVANNDLIRRISEQHAAVQADAALQSRTLLPGHPRMQELNAQLANLEAQLRAAAEKVARGLDSDATIAEGRVQNLATAINSQKDAIGATGPDQVKLGELELTAKLLKDQLEFNTSKYQEALARENADANPADARIISRAVAPQLPSFPKKVPIVIIATLAGALLSVGILIARELLSGRAFVPARAPAPLPISLDDGMRRPAPPRDEPLTLKPTFDPIAATGPIGTSDPVAAVADAALLRHAQAFDPTAELLGELAGLKRSEQALRVLVLDVGTASVSGTVALRLGRALSRSGRTVAVDLERAVALMTPESGVAERPGLTELLDGSASFAEVIHRDPQSRLHLIHTGRGTGVADQDGTANVLDALAETYDHVLMSGLGASSDFAGFVAGEHADVLVLASEAPISVAQRDACRGMLGVDGGDGFPVLTVQVEPEGSPVVRGEAA